MSDENGAPAPSEEPSAPLEAAKARGFSFKNLWSNQSVRIGAALTLVGGAIGVIANVNAVVDIFAPDKTAALVEDTRSAVVSTDAKIDEMLKLMRVQAALAGAEVDPQSEALIRTAMQAILLSGDARKQVAREALERGDVDAAAEAIRKVAAEQGEAAGGAAKAAAESWKEAGALAGPRDPQAAIEAYENARRLDPDDLDAWTSLGSVYYLTGDFAKAEEIYTHVRAVASSPSLNFAWATQGLGAVAYARGESDGARAFFDEAATIAGTIAEPRLAAVVEINRGALARRRGDFEGAEVFLRAALGHAKTADEPAYEARARSQLALVVFQRGDAEGGVALMQEANALYEARGELRHQATTLGNLGAMALAEGDAATAEGYIKQSVALGERLGLKQSVAEDLNNLGELARQRGDLDAAEDYIARAAAVAGEIGLENLKPYIAATSAQIAQDRGDMTKACALYAEASAGMEAQQDSVKMQVDEYAAAAGCAGFGGE